VPDQSPAQPAQFFARIFIEKNIWDRIGTFLAGNQSLIINCDNGLLILTTINFGFGRCNHMPPSGPWEIHPSSNMWHAGCLYLVAHGKFVPSKNSSEWDFSGIGLKKGGE